MSLNEIIPAKYRKPVYVVYALVGVALGAVAQVFGGVDAVPEWHAIVTNVYLYVGGAFGLTAATNTVVSRFVDSGEAEEIDPDDAGDVPLDEVADFEEAEESYEPRH